MVCKWHIEHVQRDNHHRSGEEVLHKMAANIRKQVHLGLRVMNHVKVPERLDLVTKEMVCPVQQVVEHQAKRRTNGKWPPGHPGNCQRGQMFRVGAIQKLNVRSNRVNQHHAHVEIIKKILGKPDVNNALVLLRRGQPLQSENRGNAEVVVGIRKDLKEMSAERGDVESPAEGNGFLIDCFYGIQPGSCRTEPRLQM